MFNYYFYCIIIIILGFVGILLNRKNFLFFLIYLEIIYNGIMLSFLFLGYYTYDWNCWIYFLIIMVLVAAEAVIGLLLAILYQKVSLNISLDNLSVLNG